MHRGRHPCHAPPIASCAYLCKPLASLHRVSAYVSVLPTTLDCELLENLCCQLPILMCSLSQAEFGLERRGEGFFLLTPTKISQKPHTLKGGFTSPCPAKPASVGGPRKPETPLCPDHPPTPPHSTVPSRQTFHQLGAEFPMGHFTLNLSPREHLRS